MTNQNRAVAVKQLPELSSLRQGRLFLRELQSCMKVDRPRVVIDCSCVRQLDRSVIYVLLCCLEEAMKRNGDVKLAALPAGAAVALQGAGVSNLFDIHDTTASAISCFHELSAGTASGACALVGSQRNPESAA